ncbi:hypothetical protein BGZ65_009928 [Modicella reniformis]|uniref:F-box domain-containing protein n=1 Tax=Modicella reniformis TaxID=1440133 RepID=A0A9P6J4P2_9FUNG|nr:hypothetical protein BGZ65_009928 [Modicella reniformis]
MSLTDTHAPLLDEDLTLALTLQLSGLDEEQLLYDEPIDQAETYDDSLYDYDDYDDHDDDRNGYDDIRVVPVSKPQKKLANRTTKGGNKRINPPSKPLPFTKIVQPIVDCPTKPLTFPLEVLGLVCSHLSQATLRHCVSLVCKDWNTVSDQYISRMGAWTPLTEDYERYLLAHIRRLDTLECWFKMDPYVPHQGSALITLSESQAAWSRFREAILAPLDQAQAQAASRLQQQKEGGDHELKRMCLLHNIEHLSLRGYNMDYKETILSIQPQFRFLKTLKLEIKSGVLDLPLFDLLDSSPKLTELTIRVPNYELVNILSGDPEDLIPEPPKVIIDPDTAHFPVKPKVIPPFKEFLDRYRLRIFDVDRVMIRQHVIARILTTCRELRTIKVTDIHDQKHFIGLGYRFIQIDEKRLMEHAKKSCPHLEWFTLYKRNSTDTDMPHLEWMASYFPNTKFLYLNCSGYQWNLPYSAAALALVPQITVLEVAPAISTTFFSENLDRILCKMPNLLHLNAFKVQVTTFLYRPPEPDQSGMDQGYYIKNNRDRKHREREEKREQRKKALLRFQRSSNGASSASSEAPSTTANSSGIWACRNLRTLSMRFSTDLLAWSEYVERNRLFRNLTDLKIGCCFLQVGQRIDYPHVAKQHHKTLEGSKPGFQLKKAELELVEPKRYTNDLWSLRGLRSLESLYIETTNLNGVLQASDFEFLRKQSSETVVCIISYDDNMEGEGESMVGGVHCDSKYSRESGNPKKAETIWPLLQAFHIRFIEGRALYVGGGKEFGTIFTTAQVFEIDLSVSWNTSSPVYHELKPSFAMRKLPSTISSDEKQWVVVYSDSIFTYTFDTEKWDVTFNNLAQFSPTTAITDSESGLVYFPGASEGRMLRANLTGITYDTVGMPPQLNDTLQFSTAWSKSARKFFYFGGKSSQVEVQGFNAFSYSTADGWTDLFNVMKGSVPPAREAACLAPAYGGSKMVLFGGASVEGGNVLADIYVLNVANMTWTKGPNVVAKDSRVDGACAVSNDYFIAWGGHGENSGANTTLVYNLKTNKWTKTYIGIPAPPRTTQTTPPASSSTSSPESSLTDGPEDSQDNISRLMVILISALGVIAVALIIGIVYLQRARRRYAQNNIRRASLKPETPIVPSKSNNDLLSGAQASSEYLDRLSSQPQAMIDSTENHRSPHNPGPNLWPQGQLPDGTFQSSQSIQYPIPYPSRIHGHGGAPQDGHFAEDWAPRNPHEAAVEGLNMSYDDGFSDSYYNSASVTEPYVDLDLDAYRENCKDSYKDTDVILLDRIRHPTHSS